MACNAAGTGMRLLLVLGKSANPHYFRKHDVRTLVQYRAQDAAWMNLALFSEWVDTFNRWCLNQGRCIVLVMDNASAHMVTCAIAGEMHGLKVRQLSHITVLYLPPNTTSVVQPCDQGVIRSLKAAYRHSLVKWQYGKFKELKQLLDAHKTNAQAAHASSSGQPLTAQAASASSSQQPLTARAASASSSQQPVIAQPGTASGRLGSLLACQIGAEAEAGSQARQKRQRGSISDRPLTLARYKPTLREANEWAHAAWEGMPISVIQNSWQKSSMLPDSF